MASINEKLNYINETKSLIKDKLNDLGSEITNQTTFRDYADKIENLYEEWPKTNDEDTAINLNNTKKGKMNLQLKGNTSQKTTQGYNLLNFSGHSQESKVTVNSDGSVTINGTGNFSLNFEEITITAGTTYSTYVELISGSVTGDNVQNGIGLMSPLGKGNWLSNNAQDLYTPTENKTRHSIWVSDAATYNNARFKIWSYVGSSAKPYEPYTGGIASPNPNYPQDIQIVTGDNTIIISNEDNTKSQTFNINLGDLELCKIGNYQDYIYKDNNKWYLHKETKKIILNGSESWYAVSSDNNWYEYGCSNIIVGGKSGYNNCLTNYFSNQTNNRCLNNSNSCLIRTPDITITTVALFKTWLSNNNVSIYYMLATPTNVEIEDITLIEQLEALTLTNSYETQTNISQTNDNLPFIINASALMKNSD